MGLTDQRLLLRRTGHDYEATAVRAVTAVSFSFPVSPQTIPRQRYGRRVPGPLQIQSINE
jgi:hypothetical protein